MKGKMKAKGMKKGGKMKSKGYAKGGKAGIGKLGAGIKKIANKKMKAKGMRKGGKMMSKGGAMGGKMKAKGKKTNGRGNIGLYGRK
tara:strand:+ start:1796 stop:2053 length:258 start_codon:yes stop_codon:yes gene_type:complete